MRSTCSWRATSVTSLVVERRAPYNVPMAPAPRTTTFIEEIVMIDSVGVTAIRAWTGRGVLFSARTSVAQCGRDKSPSYFVPSKTNGLRRTSPLTGSRQEQHLDDVLLD